MYTLKDKVCPICNERILSDAKIHEFCGLCGMGICNPSSVQSYKTDNGKSLYFCSNSCFSIYMRDIVQH